MQGKNVCILGATGAVGQQMVQGLEEADFPINDLRLLASKNSAGKSCSFKGENIEIEETTNDSFKGADIVLSAVENDVSQIWAKVATAQKAIFIDNSSAFRLTDGIPLVVANVNPEDAKKHNGIIANPNCATIISLLAIAPLHKKAKVKRIIASTYQAASGAGIKGIQELLTQQKSLALGEKIDPPSAFVDQLAMNLIPDIGGVIDNDFTTEEMKMQNEGRKILHEENLKVNCTCVRVPIARSHSISITAEFEDEITPEQARDILSSASGVKLVDDPRNVDVQKRYPMPLRTSNQDLVFVGRIRQDISAENTKKSLSLFCTGDQIRIGAATNAVKIAQLFL